MNRQHELPRKPGKKPVLLRFILKKFRLIKTVVLQMPQLRQTQNRYGVWNKRRLKT